MENTPGNKPTKDGDTFGPSSRYQLHCHEPKREGVDSQWFVLDAETPDKLTGKPSVIRQAETVELVLVGFSL